MNLMLKIKDEDYGNEAVKVTDNSDVTEEVHVDGNGSDVEGEIEILVEGDSSESEDDEVIAKECHLFFVSIYIVILAVHLLKDRVYWFVYVRL